MNKLKPCPFCGGEAQIQHQSRELYGDAVDWYGVYCKKQFCGYVSGQSTEAEAVAAWNTRADDYRHAAEYWQRMYENTFTERTCKRITLGLEREREIATVSWICSACGKHMSRDDNYCPNCGRKVVDK